MSKPIFAGERVITRTRPVRTYVDPKAFQVTPPKPKSPTRVPAWLWRSSIGVVIAIFVGWFFLASPVFRITSVEINGEASPETIATVNELVGKNIFLIGNKKAKTTILKLQPAIKTINIRRGLLHTVLVDLVERDPVMVWETQGKRYLVDKDGIVYKQMDGDFPRVVDNKNLPIQFGSAIADQTFITYVRRIKTDLGDITHLNFDYVSVPETTFQINITTKQSITIKIDTSRDLDEQLTDAAYVLDHNKDSIKQYIDVRIPGYAYIQ